MPDPTARPMAPATSPQDPQASAGNGGPPTASRRYLLRAAMDVLHRNLLPAEVDKLLGEPIPRVVGWLLQQREAYVQWYEEELYYFLLLDNFRPRGEAMDGIPDALYRGRMHVRDALSLILLSTGFSLRNPGNDTFVTVVLEQCLGIKVQDRKGKKELEAGKVMYDGERARLLNTWGNSQADIIKIVVGQQTTTRRLLNRAHQRLFQAPIDKRDPAIEQVFQDPKNYFSVLAGWLASDRYRQAVAIRRPKSDRQFVRSMYVDLLGRVPDFEELRNMRNALQSMADPTPIRTVLAKVILDSGKAELPAYEQGKEDDFVVACFRRYLAREPGQEELAAFGEALAGEACTPLHVVRALVASAEYQSY